MSQKAPSAEKNAISVSVCTHQHKLSISRRGKVGAEYQTRRKLSKGELRREKERDENKGKWMMGGDLIKRMREDLCSYSIKGTRQENTNDNSLVFVS